MPASSAAAFPPKIPTVANALPAGVAAQLAANGVPGISVPIGGVASNIPTVWPANAAAGLAGDGDPVILVCACCFALTANQL